MKNLKVAHWTFMGQWDCCKVPVVCHVINWIRCGIIWSKKYPKLAEDLMIVIQQQLKEGEKDSDDKVTLSSFGRIYPKSFQNPASFIKPQPHIKPALQLLKKRKKKLFLMSNYLTEF